MFRSNNPSRPITLATTVPTATTGAGITGIGLGTNLVTQAIREVLGISADQISRANSLVVSLNALMKKRELNPGVELFPEELQEVMQKSARFTATGTSGVVLAPSVVSSHVMQIPMNASVASSAVRNSTQDSKELTKWQASDLVVEDDNNFFANCKNLSEECRNIINKMKQNVDEKRLRNSHGNIAKSTGSVVASATITASATLASVFDSIGSVLRECAALKEFSQDDKNIYQAWSECSNAFAETRDLQACLQSLKKLRDAISNFHDVNEASRDHSVTAPVLSVFTRSVISTPFVTALESVIGSIEAAHVSAYVLKDRSKSNTLATLSRASALKNSSEEGAVTHFENLSDLTRQFREISQQIEGELEKVPQSHVDSTAIASAGLVSVLAGIPSLIAGATGVLTRELSGETEFTKDKGLSDESRRVTVSDQANTGHDLDDLLDGVLPLLMARLQQASRMGVSGPAISGASEFVTCGALIVSLNTLAGIASAVREWRSVTADDSQRLDLNLAERLEIERQKATVLQSNQDTAQTLGTRSVSAHLSVHDHLHSVIETIVIGERSSFNPLQTGEEKNINNTGHSLLNSTLMNSLGFSSGVVGVLSFLLLQSGVLTNSSLEALRLALLNSRVLNQGPDRLKSQSTQSNFSAMSNATRLMAGQSDRDESSATQASLTTTHHLAEITLSRSTTVALCQSEIIINALIKFVSEELAQQNPENNISFFDSAFTLGQSLHQRLAEIIKEALDENAGNDIPILNQDMADELASASATSIAAALITHSITTSPFRQSYLQAKEALEIKDAQKNDGLSESFVAREVSTASNVIQAFTRNCIAQLNEDAQKASVSDEKLNTAMHVHSSSNGMVLSAMSIASFATLLCEETIESIMSRSLGLTDPAKTKESLAVIMHVTGMESKESCNQVTEDSQLDRTDILPRALTGLRLTLSNLGQCLAGIAYDLEAKSAENPANFDLTKVGLEMHLTQELVLKSVVSSLTKMSLTVTKIAGCLSMLPVGSLGFIDWMRRTAKMLDQETMQWNETENSAARSTKNDNECQSQSSEVFGLSSDSTADTILFFVKILLKALILGSESALSVAKILEIVSLHQDPQQALTLLTQETLQPQGGIDALSKQAKCHLTAATVASTALSIATVHNTQSSESTESTQDTFEQQIDAVIDLCAFLADADAEDNQQILGLEKFFALLIEVLVGDKTKENQEYEAEGDISDNCDKLVAMLNRGGIPLALYHSRTDDDNPLLIDNLFMGCQNAMQVIEMFIRKAGASELRSAATLQQEKSTLLNDLQNKLAERNQYTEYSPKVKNLWNFITNKISDDLVIASRSKRTAKPGVFANPTPFTFDPKQFKKGCGLPELDVRKYSFSINRDR